MLLFYISILVVLKRTLWPGPLLGPQPQFKDLWLGCDEWGCWPRLANAICCERGQTLTLPSNTQPLIYTWLESAPLPSCWKCLWSFSVSVIRNTATGPCIHSARVRWRSQAGEEKKKNDKVMLPPGAEWIHKGCMSGAHSSRLSQALQRHRIDCRRSSHREQRVFEGGGQGAPGAEVTREEEEVFFSPLRDGIYLKYSSPTEASFTCSITGRDGVKAQRRGSVLKCEN